MDQDRFNKLVARLERQAEATPRWYRLKVVLLAGLGNAYLSAILFVLVVMFLVLLVSVAVLKFIAIKLAIIVGAFLWMVLRALRVKIAPPEGTRLTARDCPELFALIESLRRPLRAPRFHHVLLTDEFNAGVAQIPRLGVFGWPRHYLLIGLPLMSALGPEQFKAVLAHELGHLARNHGRLSNWIYRQRRRWAQLVAQLDAVKSAGAFLFRPFLNWFAPYFGAYSFPLARANEYEADATSARLASPRAAAEALTCVSVVSGFLAERYWPGLHDKADDQPQPAFAPFRDMGTHIVAGIDEAAGGRWIEQAMARQTDADDTHPALRQRLAALGEEPRLALPARGHAADRLLGPARERLLGAFDERWRTAIQPSWEARYREVQQQRTRLGELDARVEAGEALDLRDALDRARLTEIAGKDAEGALAQFRAAQAAAPDDPVACYHLGARLAQRNDPACVALLEHCLAADEDATLAVAEQLRDYHWRQGDKAQAEDWHLRLLERHALEAAARAERSGLEVNDKLDAHGLEPEALADLRAQLATIPGLRRVYLARKRVKHFPDRPCFVLGFSVTPFYLPYRKKRAQRVMELLQEELRTPGETLLLCVDGSNSRFLHKLRWKRGTRVR